MVVRKSIKVSEVKTYHSAVTRMYSNSSVAEDYFKICKEIFKKESEINKVFKNLPNIPYEYMPKLKIIGKYTPTNLELGENNRSRSATLRVAEKIKE